MEEFAVATLVAGSAHKTSLEATSEHNNDDDIPNANDVRHRAQVLAHIHALIVDIYAVASGRGCIACGKRTQTARTEDGRESYARENALP